MTRETVFTNARIVLPDEVVAGSLVIRDGRIAGVESGRTRPGEDFDGDYLIPGLIELHTDHLETHYSPRPGLRWDRTAAIQAHDAQVASSGITTVFDCLRMGSDEDGGFEPGEMREMAAAVRPVAAASRVRDMGPVRNTCRNMSPRLCRRMLSGDAPSLDGVTTQTPGCSVAHLRLATGSWTVNAT